MQLPIKHKRGTTVPTAGDLVVGEIAINTTTGVCYTKTSAGNVVAIGLDVAANWGNIGGTLSSQTDLQNALDAKYAKSGGALNSGVDLTIDYPAGDSNVQLNGQNIVFRDNTTPNNYGALSNNQLIINEFGVGFTQVTATGITFNDFTFQNTAFPGFNNAALTGDSTAVTAPLGDNDTSIATTAFVQQELLSGTANAKNLEVYVRNQTGSTLAAGSIVYVNGATGNRPTVTPAQANNDANSAQTMGFVKTSIANNGFGFVIVRGELENIDTSALAEGQQLYLSPTTPGAWTTTKPVAPAHMVYVGVVVRSHPTQGTILVAVQNGLELEELHDVLITTPADGQVLKYEAASGLWKNSTDNNTGTWGSIGGTLSNQTDLQTALNSKANLSGATFTGKVNFTSVGGAAGLNVGIGGTSTSATTAGDLWITTGGANLNFRDGTGAWKVLASLSNGNVFTAVQAVNVNSANTALRVTQLGTGRALVVEDGSTQNPDQDATVIDNNGNVGIGVNSATWTATNKLEVQGSITTLTQAYTDTSVRVATTAFVKNVVAGYVQPILSSDYWALGYPGAPNTIVTITDDAANGQVIIPSNSSIPAGAQWVFIQQGNSQMQFITDGGGAVLNSFTGATTTGGDKAVVTLIYIGNNQWHLAGNLV